MKSHEQRGQRSFVVDLLLPMSIQSDVQDNLADLTPKWIEAYGEKRARRIRRAQIVYVVIGHWWTVILENFGKLVRIVTGR